MNAFKLYNSVYFLNINNEWRGREKKPRALRKIDKNYPGVLLYSKAKVVYIKIPADFFEDKRSFGYQYPYWFSVLGRNLPLYLIYRRFRELYKKESNENSVPDPIFGGKMEVYTTIYQELIKLNPQMYSLFIMVPAIQMYKSLTKKEPMKVNPISLRFIWDIESVALKNRNLVFSYGVFENNAHPDYFDIVMVPFTFKSANTNFLSWIRDELRKHLKTLHNILFIDENTQNPKLSFLVWFIKRAAITMNVESLIFENISHIPRQRGD